MTPCILGGQQAPPLHHGISDRRASSRHCRGVRHVWRLEKYEYIISLGKELAPLDPQDKVDEPDQGMPNNVWLAANRGDDGHVVFTADSDAIITKGLAALMVRVPAMLPRRTSPRRICPFSMRSDCVPQLTRSNGLQSMVKQMKLYGLAFTAGA